MTMAQQPVTPKQQQEAVDALKKHGTKKAAARALGLPDGTFRNRLLAAARPVEKPQETLAQRREVKADYSRASKAEALLKESEKERDELRTALEVVTVLDKRAPAERLIKKQRDGDHEAVPHLMASDWHCEERVDPAQLGGIYNKYDPDIFKASAEAFFQNGLTLIEQQAPYIKIHDAVLIFGGDMITNHLHEENKSTNYMGPAKACALAFDAMAAGLDFLLEHTKYRWTVICKVGNHGRSTKEMFSATANDHSWEYLLYKMLAKRYEAADKVKFIIDEAYHTYFTCYKFIERIHHGEGVKYGGGVGGITIPINKAVSAWNQATRADLDVMGHFHQYTDGESFIVNGSLIGVNPWSLKMKFKPEPPKQTMYLIDSKYGKTGRFPIFIRDTGRW
jgi:hypothetical protein